MLMDADKAKYCLTIAGWIAALFTLFVVNRIEKWFENRRRKKKGVQLISIAIREAEEGIQRCRIIIDHEQNGKISYSKVYIGFWASIKTDLPLYVDNLETIALLHKIHYRFELVNFNFELNRPGPAAAFARTFIEEMENNLSLLKQRNGWECQGRSPDTTGASTHR